MLLLHILSTELLGNSAETKCIVSTEFLDETEKTEFLSLEVVLISAKSSNITKF